MADFRLERLFVQLDEPVPDLNHLTAVNSTAFAWHSSNRWAAQLGVTPLDNFAYAPFQRPKWHDPDDGLQTVRALIALYQEWIVKGANPISYSTETLSMKVAVLASVQTVLEEASSLGRKFYFAARDLE